MGCVSLAHCLAVRTHIVLDEYTELLSHRPLHYECPLAQAGTGALPQPLSRKSPTSTSEVFTRPRRAGNVPPSLSAHLVEGKRS